MHRSQRSPPEIRTGPTTATLCCESFSLYTRTVRIWKQGRVFISGAGRSAPRPGHSQPTNRWTDCAQPATDDQSNMPVKRQIPRRFVPLVLGRMQGTIGPLEQDRELSHEILRFGNLRPSEKGALPVAGKDEGLRSRTAALTARPDSGEDSRQGLWGHEEKRRRSVCTKQRKRSGATAASGSCDRIACRLPDHPPSSCCWPSSRCSIANA